MCYITVRQTRLTEYLRKYKRKQVNKAKQQNCTIQPYQVGFFFSFRLLFILKDGFIPCLSIIGILRYYKARLILIQKLNHSIYRNLFHLSIKTLSSKSVKSVLITDPIQTCFIKKRTNYRQKAEQRAVLSANRLPVGHCPCEFCL